MNDKIISKNKDLGGIDPLVLSNCYEYFS